MRETIAAWTLAYPPESDEPEPPEPPPDDEMDWLRERITDFAQRMDIVEGSSERHDEDINTLATEIVALWAALDAPRQPATVARVWFGPARTTGGVPYEPVGEVPSQ